MRTVLGLAWRGRENGRWVGMYLSPWMRADSTCHTREGNETGRRALDVILGRARAVLDTSNVLCGCSGEEWESLRFLEEKVLANESLHSRRFLGRGVAQPLRSVGSCIPGDPPCVDRGGRIKVIGFSHVYLLSDHAIHCNHRW